MNSIAPTVEARAVERVPLSPRQIYLILLCAVTFLIEGYDLQAIALSLPTLAHSWGKAPAAFSVAVSSMIFGATLSSAFIAPFGDVYGRKRVITWGLIVLGVCMGGTATSSTILQLQVWRFFTGIGFGAATVNVAALITEHLPTHRRNLLLTVASAAFSLGAGVGGFAAPGILGSLGWRGIFVTGGVPAGLLAVLFLATVPESLRNSEIPALLPTTGRQAAQRGVRAARRTVRDLLSRRWIAATLTLWFMCAINNVMLFLLVGWLPSMLTSVGWDIGDASRAAAAVQIGGICGGLLLTWLFDLSVSSRALAAAYCLLMVLLLVLNLVPPVVLTWSIIMGLVGGCVIGGFYALCAVAATIYPSEIRATAIGWTGAMSRVGSISGSLVGGLLLYLGLGTTRTFALLAVPAALCAGLALYLQRIRQREAVSSVDRG